MGAQHARVLTKIPSVLCSARHVKAAPMIRGYELLHELGHGTYGEVFRARSKRGSKFSTVALKFMRDTAMARREVDIVSRLSSGHNVLGILETFTHGKKRVMVMRHMITDLQTMIRNGNLTESQAKRLTMDMLRGLHYLHDEVRVVHRDLKPCNLLINTHGVLHIADFGLARVLPEHHHDAEEGGHVPPPMSGHTVTMWYRAPEVFLGSTSYGTAIDMWSAGCVVVEMVLREPLFKAETDVDLLGKMFHLLGVPTEETWPGYTRLPLTARYSFSTRHPTSAPPAVDWPRLLREGPMELEETTLGALGDMLSHLVCCDPEKRWDAITTGHTEYLMEGVPLADYSAIPCHVLPPEAQYVRRKRKTL